MDKRCFFLIFYGKKEKTGEKNRQNFGEFMLFFAFSLSSLGFLPYFLGVFVCFLWFSREAGAVGCIFAPFSLFFGGGIAFFHPFFLFFEFLIFCRAKKRQFLSEIMMKNEIYGKLFLFFCFLFFARAIFTWIFAFFAKIACKKYEHCYFRKTFFCLYYENRLENLWQKRQNS